MCNMEMERKKERKKRELELELELEEQELEAKKEEEEKKSRSSSSPRRRFMLCSVLCCDFIVYRPTDRPKTGGPLKRCTVYNMFCVRSRARSSRLAK